MQNQYSDILDDFATKKHKKGRRALLPWWIKTFSWIFMLMGALAVTSFLIGLFGIEMSLSLYGVATFDTQSASGLIIIGIFLLKAITGFALWSEKDWAVNIGLVDAVLGIAICLAMTFYSPWDANKPGLNIRLELLLLIPFLLKLRSIQHEWADRKPAMT